MGIKHSRIVISLADSSPTPAGRRRLIRVRPSLVRRSLGCDSIEREAQPPMSDPVLIPDLSPNPVPRGAKPAYHAMVKPIGAICNIDCTYCYYLHKKELLGSDSKFRITDEILEEHIRQYIEG